MTLRQRRHWFTSLIAVRAADPGQPPDGTGTTAGNQTTRAPRYTPRASLACGRRAIYPGICSRPPGPAAMADPKNARCPFLLLSASRGSHARLERSWWVCDQEGDGEMPCQSRPTASSPAAGIPVAERSSHSRPVRDIRSRRARGVTREGWARNDNRPVQATTDGRFLVFQSAADLTAGDASVVPQVFEYDAVREELVRVSVGEPGYEAGMQSAEIDAFGSPYTELCAELAAILGSLGTGRCLMMVRWWCLRVRLV